MAKRLIHMPFVLEATVFPSILYGYMISFYRLYSCYYVFAVSLYQGSLKQKLKHFLVFSKNICLLRHWSCSSFDISHFVFMSSWGKGKQGGVTTSSIAHQINPLDILSKLTIGGFDAQSGWAAGPNCQYLYWSSRVYRLYIVLYIKKDSQRKKMGCGVVASFSLLPLSNEFVSKIWHMGQNPADSSSASVVILFLHFF